ncbi:MAG TPA: HNH endonuclease signature motif containing protein [Sedimentisphaerales bacterium]|nr:HNH endonuclease signature motif containing protein [Sedimentisphaerales bacterium]
MKAAKAPSENVIKRLFALSRNVCAFPNCATAIVQPTTMSVTGKICHIKAKSPGGPRYDLKQTEKERNSFENLILLCGVHHDIVDDQPEKFSVEVLQNMKKMHERNGDIKLSQENARLVQGLIASSPRFGARCEAQVMVGSPGAIQAKYITIKTDKKSSRSIIIPGTVAEDARMYGYLNYLVKRYNEFKEWECKKAKIKMNYSLIRVAYEREMKYKIKDTPQNMFGRAVEYLQKRISNTKLGRIKKSRGQEIFSSFETFDQNELNLTKEETKYLLIIADQEGRIYSNLLSAFPGKETEIYREMLNKFVQMGLMREELDYWALTLKGYAICEDLQPNNPKCNNI